MTVSRHSPSPPSSPRPSKRVKLSGDENRLSTRASTDDSWRIPVDYRNGVVLAPMVRSGSRKDRISSCYDLLADSIFPVPTRLLSLKYGASLVWSPEIVDKAIIGCERTVDERTGVISYVKPNSKSPVFTTHPVERTHLIFQIGSSNPELAAQAAQTVLQDVAAIDLNCGCPKPFSVHAGMGAALLSTPDLLCGILSKLRDTLPANVPVSAKIRLLPDAEATRSLVSRIWHEGGVSALTVHCRTREMRPTTPAVTLRMREAVEQIAEIEAEDKTGRRIAVLYNGDCSGAAAAQEIRDTTGATSVMIARAAESNPSCFDASRPVRDAELEMIPEYLRLAKYLGNAFGNTKHCIQQITSPSTPESRQALPKEARKAFRQRISQARSYEMLETDLPGGGDLSGGKEIMRQVDEIMRARVAKARKAQDEGVETEPELESKSTLIDATLLLVEPAAAAA
ncbi:tRNA-dihydrouridine synthase 1 [Ceratobasidium sp. AG-Ba]|nr:tRNA-dihydrouridine synthase 1 [Ceratobasidium sp. AG-Ba]